MNKKWKIYEVDEEKVEELSNKYHLNKLLATILANRNIVNEEEIRLFLNPTRNDFHDPYLITDMEKAINRIVEAIEKQEKVTIYGDYDVDGITSITVLKSFLKDRGLEVSQYIPNRLHEGYGLNKNAIDKIHNNGCELMITVDCGISAIEEIEYANSLGIETIVTDHHEPGNELPNALAVIDNKLYVVLVEMKSGESNAASVQLDASATFMEYVKQTALRIKDNNGYKDFNAQNIIVRKLKLRPAPKSRPATNVAKGNIGLKQNPMSCAGNSLPLARICNPHNH